MNALLAAPLATTWWAKEQTGLLAAPWELFSKFAVREIPAWCNIGHKWGTRTAPSLLLPRSNPRHSDAHSSLQFQIWVCRAGNIELPESCGCHAASKHHPNSPFSLFKYIALSFPVSFPLSVPISREAVEAHHLSEVSSPPQLITCPQAMKQPEKQYRHLLWQACGKKHFIFTAAPHSCLGEETKGRNTTTTTGNAKSVERCLQTAFSH